MHLSGICVRELTEFKVDDDEASESSMEEQQINFIPLAPDAQSVLTPDTPSQVSVPFVQTVSAQSSLHLLLPLCKGVLQTLSLKAARQDRKPSFAKDFSSRIPDPNRLERS